MGEVYKGYNETHLKRIKPKGAKYIKDATKPTLKG